MKYLAEILTKLNISENVPQRLQEIIESSDELRKEAEIALKLYNYMYGQGGTEDEYFTCTTLKFMEDNGYFE